MLKQADGIGNGNTAIVIHISRIGAENRGGRRREQEAQYHDRIRDVQSPALINIAALKPRRAIRAPKSLQNKVIGKGRAPPDRGRDRQARLAGIRRETEMA